MSDKYSKLKLSICIPSYNRGHRALELVEKLLKFKNNIGCELEVVLSNNGSDKNTAGYQVLKDVEDKRFKYHEFEYNNRYYGNFNQVIKMSTGDWCLLISDEDEIIEENLAYYVSIIKSNPNLAVIKAAGDEYDFDDDLIAQAGKEAIDKFYLRGAYLSGVMYNRKIITNHVIDYLHERYAVGSSMNKAYYYYPHLFVDFFALLHGDYFQCKRKLIKCGEAIDDQEKNDSKTIHMAEYTTLESRMEQMQGFVQLIADTEMSELIKITCFKATIEKYIFLMGCSKNIIKDIILQFMIALIEKSECKAVIDNKELFAEFIKNLFDAVF